MLELAVLKSPRQSVCQMVGSMGTLIDSAGLPENLVLAPGQMITSFLLLVLGNEIYEKILHRRTRFSKSACCLLHCASLDGFVNECDPLVELA